MQALVVLTTILVMTQCCIEALYKLGRTYQLSVDLAKTFERRRCNHREAIEPDDCVKDVIGTWTLHTLITSVHASRAISLYEGECC